VSVKFNGGTFAAGIAALASLAQSGATSFSRATSLTNAATGNLYFDDLRVWVDADAVTDTGELKTLDDLDITSISLTSAGNQGVSISGNDVVNETTYTTSGGTTGVVASASSRSIVRSGLHSDIPTRRVGSTPTTFSHLDRSSHLHRPSAETPITPSDSAVWRQCSVGAPPEAAEILIDADGGERSRWMHNDQRARRDLDSRRSDLEPLNQPAVGDDV
jgi:hypothetical protein